MPTKMTLGLLAVFFLPITVYGSTASLKDTGGPGACTGSSACCVPACAVQIGDFHGCDGNNVAFTQTCKQRYENPGGGSLDVPGCDDVKVTFLRDPDGHPVFDIYHKPSKTYDRYKFDDCKVASVGGSQCAPSGGGCKTEQILKGAESVFD